MEKRNIDPKVSDLRDAVSYMYDLQKFRIQASNRGSAKGANLDSGAKQFMKLQAKKLKELEEEATDEIGRLLKQHPIYTEWLSKQRGVGPLLSGVMLSRFDIEIATTVSKMWAFAGLAVVDGKAARLRQGERAKFDPWLKSKMVMAFPTSVLKQVHYGPSGYYLTMYRPNPLYIKGTTVPEGEDSPPVVMWTANTKNLILPAAPAWQKSIEVQYPVPDGEIVWRKGYDDYKHRKESALIPVCMGCNGTGTYKVSDKERERRELLLKMKEAGRLDDGEDKELLELEKLYTGARCSNCNGTGGPAPWGRSAMHRHNAAARYCAKMFLAQLYVEWRTLAGLPVRPPYHEEKLGHVHSS